MTLTFWPHDPTSIGFLHDHSKVVFDVLAVLGPDKFLFVPHSKVIKKTPHPCGGCSLSHYWRDVHILHKYMCYSPVNICNQNKLLISEPGTRCVSESETQNFW